MEKHVKLVSIKETTREQVSISDGKDWWVDTQVPPTIAAALDAARADGIREEAERGKKASELLIAKVREEEANKATSERISLVAKVYKEEAEKYQKLIESARQKAGESVKKL